MDGNESKKNSNQCIPNDIIFMVLCKLPPKALVRCKLVCKSWQAFVDQHKYHTCKLILHSKSFVQSVDFEADSKIKAIDRDIPFKGTHHRMVEIAYCNGLLCTFILSKGYVVWNPILGRYKWIPPSLTPSRFENFRFWYDHSANNYKIVRFIRFDNDSKSSHHHLVEIHSQSTNIWQPKEILSSQIISFVTYSGFLVKDALYWMIFHNMTQNYKRCIGVLCYDTVRAIFYFILPRENVRSFEILGDINERLCIAHCHEGIIHLWA